MHTKGCYLFRSLYHYFTNNKLTNILNKGLKQQILIFLSLSSTVNMMI